MHEQLQHYKVILFKKTSCFLQNEVQSIQYKPFLLETNKQLNLCWDKIGRMDGASEIIAQAFLVSAFFQRHTDRQPLFFTKNHSLFFVSITLVSNTLYDMNFSQTHYIDSCMNPNSLLLIRTLFTVKNFTFRTDLQSHGFMRIRRHNHHIKSKIGNPLDFVQ